MKPKTIIIAIVLALLAIILFNNKEEASFGYLATLEPPNCSYSLYSFYWAYWLGRFYFAEDENTRKNTA